VQARFTLPLSIAVLVFALTGVARADTYCVNASGCTGVHDKGGDLQAALTAAEGSAGPDTVKIGASPDPSPGFTYNNPDAVHIVGTGGRSAGRAGPTLTDSVSSPSGHVQLKVLGSTASTISGIAVVVASGSGNTGIETTGTIEDVLVASDDPPGTGATGVRLRAGGGIVDSDVLLGRAATASAGVVIAESGAAVSDSHVDASDGITTTSGVASGVVQRVRVDFDTTGALARGGQLTVEDALFVNRAEASVTRRGLSVSAQSADATLTANHVTIAGTADPGAIGLLAQAAPTHRGDLFFRNGIVSGYPASLSRAATGAGIANLVTDYSDYSGSTSQNSGPGALEETNHTFSDPGFNSPTDFHLRADSPLIDVGDPAGLVGFESALDASGQPRILDGGGDCVARRDIGAFEFQPGPRAPVAIASATPERPITEQPVSFDASDSCDPDGDPLTYSWAFDQGSDGAGVSFARGFSTAGLHFGTVTVTDSTGRSTSATTTVRVSAPRPPKFAGVGIPNQTVKVSKQGLTKVKLRCPADTVGACTGKLTLTRASDKNMGAANFAIARGATRTVTVKLTKRARAALKKAKRLNATAKSTAHDTNGTTKRSSGTIKLVAPR
jgi:hypothetical protein